MTVTVSGGTLVGTTSIVASKSVVHRLLICAALCDTPTVVDGVTFSEDIDATIRCLQRYVADITCEGDRVTVSPRKERDTAALLDCGESGSTLRFLMPIVAACGGAQFTGRGRLSQRPLAPIYPVLETHGCCLSAEGAFPLTVSGRLQGTEFEISGSLSSQFVSGLLMAAPLMNDTCRICVTGEMTSYPYIALTVQALAQFGVCVTQEENTFVVTGRYTSPSRVQAEGDWSNAAFWLVGAAVSNSQQFTLSGLSQTSAQGDRAIVSLLCQAGCDVLCGGEGLRVVSGATCNALSVDAEPIPDLVPILAVLATALSGETVFYNASRLIHKESNRLQSVCDMITALGGDIAITDDGLRVRGSALQGGTVQGCNDHRIVMAAAIAALRCNGSVTIVGAEAVNKSYPTFFDEIEKRGMNVCRQFEERT